MKIPPSTPVPLDVYGGETGRGSRSLGGVEVGPGRTSRRGRPHVGPTLRGDFPRVRTRRRGLLRRCLSVTKRNTLVSIDRFLTASNDVCEFRSTLTRPSGTRVYLNDLFQDWKGPTPCAEKNNTVRLSGRTSLQDRGRIPPGNGSVGTREIGVSGVWSSDN